MMLTSTASQYLHPDYLQPLPTTLDAKKSPLALLAQTCSNIGKDTSPPKPIIPPIDKKDGRQSSPKSGGHDVDNKRISSAEKKDEKSRKTPTKDVPPPLVSVTSSDKRSSPLTSRGSPLSSDPVTSASGSVSSSNSTIAPSAGAQSNSHISLSCGNVVLEVKHNESATANLPKSGLPPTTSQHQPLPGATLKPTPVSTSSSTSSISSLGSYMTDPHLLGHPLSLDASMQSAYASALAAHAGLNMLKPGELPGLNAGVSPYVAYAQVKTATGATTLVPICRDPYCTNCQLTMRSAQLSTTCGAGCTQCTHDKMPGSAPGMPILPLPGSTLSATGLNSLGCSIYPHSVIPSPAHHGPGLPYVCNWMSGTEHCGKRFTTSEDLLHHLRTHTSSEGCVTSLSSVLPSYSLPSAISSLGTYPHFSSAAGSISPSALHRYPTSLSPLSSALSASRYHPYKSGLASLTGAPGAPTLPMGVGAYYSPYSLYGSRLGPAAVP
ncbi:zinc finger protein Noc-like [Tubulanus polymorphus]|uniref:zinc finger protein Noc-like n=1 Tax=Tubulanus polymorphus TaxID=672921 RepID=UPI003DA53AC2